MHDHCGVPQAPPEHSPPPVGGVCGGGAGPASTSISWMPPRGQGSDVGAGACSLQPLAQQTATSSTVEKNKLVLGLPPLSMFVLPSLKYS